MPKDWERCMRATGGKGGVCTNQYKRKHGHAPKLHNGKRRGRGRRSK